MKTTARVLVADEHAIVRTGIRALLSGVADLRVVGEARHGPEALRLVRARRPDVVLMDLTTREPGGLDATAQIVQRHPRVGVLIFSALANEEYALRALRVGARGYVLKDGEPSELVLAIRAVARGDTYLTPAISNRVIDDYRRRLTGEPDPLASLTPRHRQVLQLIAQGHCTKEIAFQLQRSVKTIETHRSQLMRRLGIRDVAGLVRFAIRVGLVSLDA